MHLLAYIPDAPRVGQSHLLAVSPRAGKVRGWEERHASVKSTHGHDMRRVKKRRKRKIKAIACFRRLSGHYMEDQFGQELGRGTESIVVSKRS
jgi:hypothetical protein